MKTFSQCSQTPWFKCLGINHHSLFLNIPSQYSLKTPHLTNWSHLSLCLRMPFSSFLPINQHPTWMSLPHETFPNKHRKRFSTHTVLYYWFTCPPPSTRFLLQHLLTPVSEMSGLRQAGYLIKCLVN